MIPYLPSLRSGILWRGDVQYFWQSPTGVNAADPQIPALPLLEPSGGLSAISGTNIMTLTNAGQLLGVGALSGTDALTLTNSASITGFGALAGTNALTFTNTGALGSESQIAGTNAITLTNAGAISGTGALSGVDSLSLTNSAALSGIASIAANNVLTFGNTGTVEGFGSVSGLNSLTFTNAGSLDTPSGAIQGTNAITLSNIGELSASGALAGTNAILISSSATFDSVTPQVPEVVQAGGTRRPKAQHVFQRYHEPEVLQEHLKASLRGKPKIKDKVVRIISYIVADTSETPDTAIQRLRASLEATFEPVRGDYIDAVNLLLAFAAQRRIQQEIKELAFEEEFFDGLDNETLATVLVFLT